MAVSERGAVAGSSIVRGLWKRQIEKYPDDALRYTFLGIVVLWQMRREPRPLAAPLVAQRLQARVGIVLALVAAAVVYGYVGWHGPR